MQTKNDTTIPPLTLIPKELKYCPTMPSIKAIGTNTQSSTALILSTLKAISRTPSKLAFSGLLSPSCIFLEIFSTTTIASSINIPIPSVRASSVRRFRSKPKTSMIKNVPTMLAGIASAAMTVALKLRKKKKTMTTVSATPSIMSNLT